MVLWHKSSPESDAPCKGPCSRGAEQLWVDVPKLSRLTSPPSWVALPKDIAACCGPDMAESKRASHVPQCMCCAIRTDRPVSCIVPQGCCRTHNLAVDQMLDKFLPAVAPMAAVAFLSALAEQTKASPLLQRPLWQGLKAAAAAPSLSPQLQAALQVRSPAAWICTCALAPQLCPQHSLSVQQAVASAT